MKISRIIAVAQFQSPFPVRAIVHNNPSFSYSFTTTIGWLAREKTIFRFQAERRVYLSGIGYRDNPFLLFDGHAVAMNKVDEFRGALEAHAKLTED